MDPTTLEKQLEEIDTRAYKATWELQVAKDKVAELEATLHKLTGGSVFLRALHSKLVADQKKEVVADGTPS